MVGVSGSTSKRRMGVLVNYTLLCLSLVSSIVGFQVGWSISLAVIFWLSVVLVIATFVPVHLGTGLWKLAHAREAVLDERQLQQTLHSLRHAYVLFSIVTLVIVLILVMFGLGDQTLQLVVFWVLLYLAHTLPSSILGWTLTRVPAQADA